VSVTKSVGFLGPLAPFGDMSKGALFLTLNPSDKLIAGIREGVELRTYLRAADSRFVYVGFRRKFAPLLVSGFGAPANYHKPYKFGNHENQHED